MENDINSKFFFFVDYQRLAMYMGMSENGVYHHIINHIKLGIIGKHGT